MGLDGWTSVQDGWNTEIQVNPTRVRDQIGYLVLGIHVECQKTDVLFPQFSYY